MSDCSRSVGRAAVVRRGLLAFVIAALVTPGATTAASSTPLFNGMVPNRIVDTRESLPGPTLRRVRI